jgi:hypothetical protein
MRLLGGDADLNRQLDAIRLQKHRFKKWSSSWRSIP